jgi:hypothetical protein
MNRHRKDGGRVKTLDTSAEWGKETAEAVQNVGRNAISTTLSFEYRRYFRFPEVAVRVDSTFWTAPKPIGIAIRPPNLVAHSQIWKARISSYRFTLFLFAD